MVGICPNLRTDCGAKASVPSGARNAAEEMPSDACRFAGSCSLLVVGSLLIFGVFVIGSIREVFTLVTASCDHKTLRIALYSPDVQEVGATPPPSHRFNMLGGAADCKQRRRPPYPATASERSLDIGFAAQ